MRWSAAANNYFAYFVLQVSAWGESGVYILQAQNIFLGQIHVRVHLDISNQNRSSDSPAPANIPWDPINIKMSSAKAFCPAIVFIFQQVKPLQEQHYINTRKHMKNN